MENNEQNLNQFVNAVEGESDSYLSDVPIFRMTEQEENEQFARFEEDDAAYHGESIVIFL